MVKISKIDERRMISTTLTCDFGVIQAALSR